MNPIYCSEMDVFDGKQVTSFNSNFHMAQTWKAKQFQEFIDDWPSTTKGRKIDLTQLKEIPVSLYSAQFDEICEGWYAEALAEDLEKILVNHVVETDARGHEFFALSNE